MTTVQQAACNALATYLKGALEDVAVNDRWPDPDCDLPPRGLSILLAGNRRDEMADAELVKVEGTGNTRTFHWLVKSVEQPLQLDVWAHYDAVRDVILAQLDDALNKGTMATLGDPFGSVTRDGPLLAFNPEDGHEGFVDFSFDGPSNGDSPGRHTRSEYRATISGTASMTLTVKTQHPVLRVAGLRIRYGELPAEHAVEPINIPVEE